MPLSLLPEEPVINGWRLEPLSKLLGFLLSERQAHTKGPILIAIDGRSASGKTSLANALVKLKGDAGIVHTDDIAWHHSFFN